MNGFRPLRCRPGFAAATTKLATVSFAAAAADQAAATIDTGWPVLVMACMWAAAAALFGALGWAVASLETIADWEDRADDGQGAALRRRLNLLKGLLGSISAAWVVAMVGLHFRWPTMMVMIGMFLAGTAGERFLRPLTEQLMTRVAAGFAAIFGGSKP